YSEMLGRIQETDHSVPDPLDRWLYFTRTEQGKQYPIYCRREDHLEAREEVLLDPNELAVGQAYFRVGVYQVSPDHRLLAYSTDTAGSEIYTLRVKDLKTGRLLADEIPNTYYAVAWANDNRTLYYNTLDAAHRPFQVRRHTLGGEPAKDPVIYTEPDEAFRVGITRSRSKRFLFLGLTSSTSTEVRFKSAEGPEGEFRVVEPRRPKIEYFVEHHGEHFYIRTNTGDAKNFKLVKAPVADPGRARWRTLIPHSKTTVIEDVDAFENHLVVWRRDKGLKQIQITDLKSGESHNVSFAEPAYTIMQGRNPEFRTASLRFTYASLVTPASVYDYDMIARTRRLRKQQPVLGGYDPERYQSERIFARAGDGFEIPISLVYKKGFERDGQHPALLYGYGSYGATSEPFFSSDRLSLLDRGFVYAIAHIRGGSDVSRYAYEDGKLFKKKNTFTDFIACGERLVAEKYTAPDRLTILGGSAGGLLMGAVLNLRPDLFKAAIAKVPFVDVINTMLDASIPLTAQEYEEWGNPNDKKYYQYMKSYSPYDNVAAKPYPELLITAGLNDPRVAYWEPAKWTAKLRATKQGGQALLLKTNMGAGHGGASGRYDRLKETAFEYAFLLDRLGLGK
ncbi:MAG: S9 family peptidase, partial [Acidobacteria bacterium]|nr:S9 family peptidase [Acidobacteriota bacterium]